MPVVPLSGTRPDAVFYKTSYLVFYATGEFPPLAGSRMARWGSRGSSRSGRCPGRVSSNPWRGSCIPYVGTATSRLDGKDSATHHNPWTRSRTWTVMTWPPRWPPD